MAWLIAAGVLAAGIAVWAALVWLARHFLGARREIQLPHHETTDLDREINEQHLRSRIGSLPF